MQAIEQRFMQREIEDSAYRYQQQMESGEKVVVGVNRYALDDEPQPELLRVDEAQEQAQIERLQAAPARPRRQRRARSALNNLQVAAEGDENLMPYLIDAVQTYASVGEICCRAAGRVRRTPGREHGMSVARARAARERRGAPGRWGTTGVSHVAIAVHSIEKARPFFENVLGLPFVRQEDVPTEGVRVAFFDAGNCFIELLEPLHEDSGVARFLQRRGEGIHHIALAGDDLEKPMRHVDEHTPGGAVGRDPGPRPAAPGRRFCIRSRRSAPSSNCTTGGRRKARAGPAASASPRHG